MKEGGKETDRGEKRVGWVGRSGDTQDMNSADIAKCAAGSKRRKERGGRKLHPQRELLSRDEGGGGGRKDRGAKR